MDYNTHIERKGTRTPLSPELVMIVTPGEGFAGNTRQHEPTLVDYSVPER